MDAISVQIHVIHHNFFTPLLRDSNRLVIRKNKINKQLKTIKSYKSFMIYTSYSQF